SPEVRRSSIPQRFRGLWRSRFPGYSTSIVICLALGTSASAAVLVTAAGVNGRPLPYSDPLLPGVGASEWFDRWTPLRRSVPEIQQHSLEVLTGVVVGLA